MRNAAATGYCSNPVRLAGASSTFDSASGAAISSYTSATEPGGLTLTRCGNRRSARCRSCSHEYKGDTWHMIMAGAAGGMKGVPEGVGRHPMAFLTLTAPSFGSVHSATRDRGHLTCEHGRTTRCRCDHVPNDEAIGDAVCPDCYDYAGHVVWQHHAPELWRRFTIRLRRELARRLGLTQREAQRLVRLQFAKVAEFQRRGAVHFHAIIRLDGVDASDAYPAPPAFVTTAHLLEAIQAAVRRTAFTVPPVFEGDVPRRVFWGKQFDVREITRSDGLDGGLSDHAVAAYIAKYATKATEDLEPSGTHRDHIRGLRAAVRELGAQADEAGPYGHLHRWETMLGFRGHFSTKSRRYSVTLGTLRGARKRWRLEQMLGRTDDLTPADADTVLVVGSWSFAGMGWLTPGDQELAAQAADAAREWRAERRRQRNDQPKERKMP